MKNDPPNNFEPLRTRKKREPPKVTVHHPASYSDKGTSSGKILKRNPFGYQVARTDREPPGDHESARADSHGLSEDHALGLALSSVAIHVEHGLK